MGRSERPCTVNTPMRQQTDSFLTPKFDEDRHQSSFEPSSVFPSARMEEDYTFSGKTCLEGKYLHTIGLS